MSNENELLGTMPADEHDFFDLDAFEEQLRGELEVNLQGLEALKLAKKNIGNTEYLGDVV